MNSNLREKVQGVSTQAIDMLEKSISGKSEIEGGLMDRLIRMVGMGVKIEHMNQLKEQNDRSFGLRLLTFLPKDEESRRKYIEMTNPELKQILSSRPKGIEKK